MEEINKKIFASALAFFLKNKPKKNLTQKKLSEITGISQPYISLLKHGRKFGHENIRRKIAAVYGYSYDQFLEIGRELLETDTVDLEKFKRPEKKDFENGQVIHLEHQSIINKFQDQNLACELNRMLLEIENAAPDKLTQIKGYIQGIRDSVCIKKIAENDV